jgi:hypothetical protein
MEANQPEVRAASGGFTAPKNIPLQSVREPFTASAREIYAAFASYAVAYLYIRMYGLLLADAVSILAKALLAAFTLGYFALGEVLHRDSPRARESWVWLGCAALILGSILFDRGNAWDEGLPFLFLHIFAVWWALSRSGTLLEGESGRLLPLDALNGFVTFPFSHLLLRLQTAGFALSRLRGEREKKEDAEGEPGSLGWTLLISAAALGLLALAASLLIAADDGFAHLLDGFVDLFRFDWDPQFLLDFLLRLLFSLPVGAYLYGLLGGTRRIDRDGLRRRVAGTDETLEMLRGVPERVWFVLLGLFCVLYALFFAVQGRYLFGAFTRTLPEGFVVAEYARQGFFELCKVMAVNFALLWLALRSARDGKRPALRLFCLVLLAESLLLAVVAFSKLALYIDCFGFTPRRLQSTWLVCVLAFGCLCAMWSLMKNAKTFRVWMYFGAVTLSLLCLY